MTTLDQILAATRERVARAKERAKVRPLEKAAAAYTPRGFRKRLAAMSQLGPAVIGRSRSCSMRAMVESLSGRSSNRSTA